MALPLLKLGSQDAAVVQLRNRLAVLGYALAGTTDATIYDSAVESAVREFQTKAKILVDGEVGPETWGALGADAMAVADSGWGKILMLALAAGGLYWWWKKRQGRAATGEFSRRVSHGRYGDAVDIELIEQPLLLVEKGDCAGAARLLVKRRGYVGADSSPVNRRIFKRVVQDVTEACPKEVTEHVHAEIYGPDDRGTWSKSRGGPLRYDPPEQYGPQAGRTPWDKLASKMRRKGNDLGPVYWEDPRTGARRTYVSPPGLTDEEARREAARLYRQGGRGATAIRRGGKTLYPLVRNGKVVYVEKGARKDQPGSKPRKPLTSEQATRKRLLTAIRDEKAREAKRKANELRRKVPHYRKEDERHVYLPGDDD